MNLRHLSDDVRGLVMRSLELQDEARGARKESPQGLLGNLLDRRAFILARQAANKVTVAGTSAVEFSFVHCHAAYAALNTGKYQEAFAFANSVLATNPPEAIRGEMTQLLSRTELAPVVASRSRGSAQAVAV